MHAKGTDSVISDLDCKLEVMLIMSFCSLDHLGTLKVEKTFFLVRCKVFQSLIRQFNALAIALNNIRFAMNILLASIVFYKLFIIFRHTCALEAFTEESLTPYKLQRLLLVMQINGKSIHAATNNNNLFVRKDLP